MKEIWKDVIDYSGLYEVSSLGRINSRISNKIIKLQKVPNKKYYRAYLYKDGICKRLQIGRIVYEAFVGKIPDGGQIDHIDESPDNNSVKNLRCVSAVENQFNRSKTKKNKYMRIFKDKNTYKYNVTVCGERIIESGFKTALDAFTASQEIRKQLAKKHSLFCTV